MSAHRTPLADEWLFRIDPQDVGVRERWFEGPAAAKPGSTGDGSWRAMHVPGNWDDFTMPPYDGIGWFRREFTLPGTRPAGMDKFALLFTGVDDEATVYLNGVEIAKETRVDRRFAVALDAGRVKPGANTLAVRIVDHGGPGGIIRPVYLATYKESLNELLIGEHRNAKARASHDWVRDSVVYEVYLRSFSKEGTFRGLESRLDELKDLGVTVLWLMPIHPVGAKNRKGTLGSPYSVTDFTATNPEFGTIDDFKALLKAAHARGLKLIIDLVANHTAWDGPLFDKHPDWYTRDASGKIVPPVADWSDVADLNYDVPGVRAYMRDAMTYWIRDIGIDGFRCDVAGMVPLDFWDGIVPELQQMRPIMMLAEDDAPAEHLTAFDLTYDWRTWSLLGGLKEGTLTPAQLRQAYVEEDLEFPRGAMRLRFSDNHDKCAWDTPAMARYGPSGARLAAVLTFALPGVPLIYNGQESGNTQKLSLFEKMEIDWKTPDAGMRDLYRSLAKLRTENAPLRRGTLEWFAKEPWAEALEKSGILVFARRHEGKTTWVVANLTPKPATVDLPTGAPLASAKASDLLSNAKRSGSSLSFPPHGYCIMTVND